VREKKRETRTRRMMPKGKEKRKKASGRAGYTRGKLKGAGAGSTRREKEQWLIGKGNRRNACHLLREKKGKKYFLSRKGKKRRYEEGKKSAELPTDYGQRGGRDSVEIIGGH